MKDNVDIRTVYPSAIILPFYVDQDVSWSAIPYKNVANDLSQYASSVIPSALFEYLFGISTNVIMDKKQERLDSILQGKLGFENEYASLLSIAEKKQGEITLQQFIEQKAQKLAKTNYVEVKNTLNEKIADLTERINKLSSEIRILEKQQRVQRDTIGLRFNELKEKLKITFSTASLNELSFLEFKTITASGTVSNVTLFSIYIIYLRLLSEYSVVELPFGFDALIKDELTENNIKLMYETLEKYILNSNKQVFVVMLKDKLKYITGKHNLIELNKPILDKTKYDELLGEFTYMRKL